MYLLKNIIMYAILKLNYFVHWNKKEDILKNTENQTIFVPLTLGKKHSKYLLSWKNVQFWLNRIFKLFT